MTMVVMDEDEWVTAAMTDDTMVAEMLLRMKHSSGASRPRVASVTPDWGVQRPRSRPVSSSQKEDCGAVPTRFSPVTPLSWSGGTTGSPSNNNGVDGFEASSRMNCFSPVNRSKGIVTNDAVNSINKKSRKRKTYAELKEEENMLAQERVCLNMKRGNLDARYKEHTATSERLKRLKEEQNLHHTVNARADFDQHVQPHFNYAHQMEDHNLHCTMDFSQGVQAYSIYANHTEASTSKQATLRLPEPGPFSSDKHPPPSSINVGKTEATQNRVFILPDLNETPSENESG